MKSNILLIVLLWSIQTYGQDLNITFPSDNLTLNGTLSIPTGLGPFPIVILVHGSGANDRDQTLHLTGTNSLCLYPNLYNDTVRNFKDLAQEFKSRGTAVLRYDKRTFTYGNQLDLKEITVNDFISDIHSAIDFVKTQPKIDTNCISLLGHSQGANLLPIVAAQRSDLQSLISLGSPSSTIDSLLAIQFRNIYYKCLNDTINGNLAYNQILTNFNLIQNNAWDPNTPYLGGYPKFWKNWMNISQMAIANYKALNIPTLFIHGTEDLNIPITDAQKLDSQLPNATVIYLNGINHFMTNSNQPKVDTSVYNAIFNWNSTHSCINTGIQTQTLLSNLLWTQNQTSISIQSSTSNGLIQSISLYDLSGTIYFKQIDLSVNSVEIPKSHLTTGFYLIKATLNNESYHLKLLIH
jgi:alpha-beta hydrolase superfamily lysophospholipase